jgi:type II secretory pathway pseudopilin PulG
MRFPVSQLHRRRRGALSLDALTAVFVTSLGAAAFFSLMPIVDRSQRMAREESVATQLTNRMIEQLQLLKPADVTASTLSQLNLIDADQTTSPYSFSSVPLDDASRYSPRQALREGTGTLEVLALPNNSAEVRIRIGWKSASGRARTVQSGVILGGFR